MSLLTTPRGQHAAVAPASHAPTGAPSVSNILRARRGLHIDTSNAHRCLRAGTRFEKGDVILVLEGLLSDVPSRYSVQVGAELHVQPAPGIPEDSVRAAWRYLNHSCRPNGAFRGPVLSAIEAIEPGDEITFDYNTTEGSMAEPFVCRCGHCNGRTIAGYAALAKGERQRIKGWVAAYLLAGNDAGGQR